MCLSNNKDNEVCIVLPIKIKLRLFNFGTAKKLHLAITSTKLDKPLIYSTLTHHLQ